MWPRSLPREVLENPLRSAEIKVFNALAQCLGDEFTVYYSRPWLGVTPTGGEKDGECDFLIAHRDFGILALEVKGGEISYDPRTDKWTSKDRHGFVHSIKDPIYQARTAKHNLLKKLHAMKNMHSRRIGAHHGVIFPDCDNPPRDLRADAPRYIFCCRADVQALGKWVLKRMDQGKPGEGEEMLGADGVAAFDSILASPFTLRVPLGHWLTEDEHAIETLTPQQFHILEAIQDIPRAGIAGGAGTGKTVLAMEDARRFSLQSLKTLLVCFNSPLAEELGRRMHAAAPAVETGTFHQICMRAAKFAGIPFTNDGGPSFFREVLPECLTCALEVRPELKWDVIIVDEAQDFDYIWWIALDAALAGRTDSRLHVFFDSNQRVYSRGGRLPHDIDLVPIRLTRNLRNTRSIHEVGMCHYGGIEILPNNIEGQKVEAFRFRYANDTHNWLHEIIRRLVRTELLSPGSIAVLHGASANLQNALHNGLLGGSPIVPAERSNEDAIVVDSINRFKGLERSTVILIATPDLLTQVEAAYVATTRPRVHLLVAGDPQTVDWILNIN
jgi:hypothetical protein